MSNAVALTCCIHTYDICVYIHVTIHTSMYVLSHNIHFVPLLIRCQLSAPARLLHIPVCQALPLVTGRDTAGIHVKGSGLV